MPRKKHPRIDGVFDWFRKTPKEAPKGAPRKGPKGFDPRVDYYQILGVRPTATPDELRKAYRELVKRYHPDVNPSPEAAEMFHYVSAAYHLLEDPDRRLAYDQARGVVPVAVPVPPPQPGVPPPVMPGGRMVPAEDWEEQRAAYEARRRAPAPPPTPARPLRPTSWMWEKMFGSPELLEKTAQPPVPKPVAPKEAGLLPPDFPSVEEVAKYIRATWPLDPIWSFVRQTRGTEAFQKTKTMAVDRLAGADPRRDMAKELAPWIGIPEQAIDNYRRRGIELWQGLFYPMFDLVGMALQSIKPADIPGTFYIFTDHVVVDLYYTEETGRRLGK